MTDDRGGGEDTADRLASLMATEGRSVKANTNVFNRGRYRAVEELPDYELLKARARSIKEASIDRLPELIDELTASVEENGGTVYLADDAEDANRYIEQLAREHGVETAVKSKSMTTEELELNEHLATGGIDAIETDLGEFVIQLAGEDPSHLIAPAIHRSREEIARLFNDRFEPEEPLETAEELVRFAREHLLERIVSADLGVTGANFIVAETGTLVLVTSEGNARKCVTAPDLHVAVAGVEKIVPTFADLHPFVELIGRSGTGQKVTAYLSFLTPPVASPTIDFAKSDVPGFGGAETDRSFHLVLVDNGRLAMRDDGQLRETLYCIRCGACANSCANFQHVGGHAFGGETYTGGIGTGWEAGIFGLEAAESFNDLCTGCSRCVNACPVGIDIPWINTVVRDRINRGTDPAIFDHLVDGLVPDLDGPGVGVQKRLFGNFERLARVASATAPVSNWIANADPTRRMLERVAGVDRRRPLPRFTRATLEKWMDSRSGIEPRNATRTVALYPDPYTNFVHVERGKAAVRALESLDIAVELPPVTESGRAPLSQGMIATAERNAKRTYSGLAPHLDADRPVVAIEPSDLAMFRRDYEKLVSSSSFERIATASQEIMEFIHRQLENDEGDRDRLRGPDASGVHRVAYHAHCQQRTLGLERPTVDVLDGLGYDVVTSDVECCGMAGSFGYKQAYFDLAESVGDDLAAQFREPSARDRTILASGTSCVEQLDTSLERQPMHPIELVAPTD